MGTRSDLEVEPPTSNKERSRAAVAVGIRIAAECEVREVV